LDSRKPRTSACHASGRPGPGCADVVAPPGSTRLILRCSTPTIRSTRYGPRTGTGSRGARH
jgi:hypothetical protein